MCHGENTGAWMSVKPSTVNGTELGFQERRDAPPDLPHNCDGCGAGLSISHAIDFKKGGLLNNLHKNICDGVADLYGRAFTPSHMRDDHLIYAGRVVREGKAQPPRSPGNNNPPVLREY